MAQPFDEKQPGRILELPATVLRQVSECFKKDRQAGWRIIEKRRLHESQIRTLVHDSVNEKK